MKKFYSLALALAAGLTVSAQTAVVNETTGVGYDDFKAAYDAEKENEVLVVNESATAGFRITGNINRVIKGASQDVVLKWGDRSKPMVLSDNSGKKAIVIENITIGDNDGGSSQDFIRAAKFSGCVVTLNNVIIKNVTTTSPNGLINAQEGGTVNINGVTVEGCTLAEGAYDMKLNNSNNSTISGVNTMTISMPAASYITNKGVAEGNNVTLVLDDARSHMSVVVKDCTDASLFKVSSNKYVLKAEGNDLVAFDKALAGVDPVTNETTGTGYNNFIDAFNAASDGEVLVVNADQTIGTRLAISKNITVKGGKEDVKIIRGANSIIFMPNTGAAVLTLENIIFDGNNVNGTVSIEASKGANVYLNNVKFINTVSNNNQGIVCAKGDGHVHLNGVTFENCTVPEGRGIVFVGSKGSSISGDNSCSIYIQSALSITATDLTNETPVELYFDDTRANGQVAVVGGAGKFVAAQSFAEIVDDGENAVANIAAAAKAFLADKDGVKLGEETVSEITLNGTDIQYVVFDVPAGCEIYYNDLMDGKSDTEITPSSVDVANWIKYEGTPVAITKTGSLEYISVNGNAQSAVAAITVKGISTGVDSITVTPSDDNAPVEYFNLQGVRVEQPAAGGLYIKRQGSKVSKVVIR